MLIADTSVWIAFLKHNSEIFPIMKLFLEQKDILGLEYIFAELLQGAKNENEINIIYTYWDNIPKIDESDMWIQAGIYASKNNLYSRNISIFDSYLMLVGRITNSKIWTLDKRFLKVLDNDLIYKE
jgi:predicted nucleic acid-binding protein